MSRAIPAILWIIFALVLILAGVLITRACGAGWPLLNFCPASTSEFEQLGQRHAALLAERESRIETLRRAPQCRAPEPVPAEQRPEEQAALQCQPPPTDETLVLVDVSYSMEIDYILSPELLAESTRLNEALANTTNPLQRALLLTQLDQIGQRSKTSRKPDRIDVARDALRPLVTGLQGDARLKLMSFAECRVPVRQEGSFGAGDAARYERAIDGLRLRSYTALAEALDQLPAQTEAGRSPDRPVNIVILSDGEDSCGGDPCAAAERLRQALPHAHVSLIALVAGARANSCIADRTGGRFLTADNADELVMRLRQTTGQLDAAECASLDSSATDPE